MANSTLKKKNTKEEAVLTLKNIHKSYGDLEVIKGVDLQANRGDVISMIGSSGSGKSTLLRCANLLEIPQSGDVIFEGDAVKWKNSGRMRKPADDSQLRLLRTNLSMVFQQFNLWSHMSILQNVMEAPVTVLGRDKHEVAALAMELLAKVAAVRPFDLKRTSDKLTVLYVGRLEKRKGILDLFQAIPLLLKEVPNATFIIAGSDNSPHDGFQRRTGMDYPTYFKQKYGQLLPHVTFMGRVSDETLHELYQSCDLFVAPSLYESFGLIYIEAMNYAKPVIGCRAGGIPEVIDDGVTGLLVDPEAPKALAEAMVSLLKSPRKLYELGMAGRQQLLSKFTYIQMARNFERVYRAVLHDSVSG